MRDYAPQDEVGVRAHRPERDDDVTGLERSRGSLRQHRREEHEVLRADDRRAAAAEVASDVRAGEAAPCDQGSALRFPVGHGVVLASRLVAVQISVIGSGAEHERRAEQVGRLLAERGCTVVTGGLGEVMAAAARGAKEAGGATIGILPAERREDANEWIDHAVVTGIGHGRNLAVAASGEVVIAVGGSWGTLAEIAFARRLGRPVVILEPGWTVEGEGIERADSPEQAVELALAHL
jgi:uncharacterized protein (TIGR00725 family)